MFFIACKNGFVKDFNGRLIYSADVRNAKPFISHKEAYQFAVSTALANHYYAILSSDGPYNIEMKYEALDNEGYVIEDLITDDDADAQEWTLKMRVNPKCERISQSCELGNVYLEKDIWKK